MKQATGETTENTQQHTEDKHAGAEIKGESSSVPDTEKDNTIPDLDTYIETIQKTVLD